MGRAHGHARRDVNDGAEAIVVRPLNDADIVNVVALWRASGLVVPHNDPVADIALCRRSGHGDVLVAVDGGAVVASVMVGHDGHRGWVYYLAVHPHCRREGLGRRLMAEGEAWLRARGVRKLELMIRSTNEAVKGFYSRLGYAEEPVTVMSRWLDGTRPGMPPPKP